MSQLSKPIAEFPPRPLPVPPEDLSDEFLLRTWRDSDAPALAKAWLDPALMRWLDPPHAAGAARGWIEGEPERRLAGVALDLVIDLGGEVGGEVGFSSFDPQRRAALVGYWVGPDWRGHGLASRALVAAGDWFVGVTGARALVAECDLENAASHRTAEDAGYQLLAARHLGKRVYVRR